MDIGDEMMMMMMHYFMQEEENAADDEEEHLTIIAAPSATPSRRVSNVVPTRGGSKLGRRKTKQRQGMEGHVMLHADYFADNAFKPSPAPPLFPHTTPPPSHTLARRAAPRTAHHPVPIPVASPSSRQRSDQRHHHHHHQ
jgi:hypothetical protein